MKEEKDTLKSRFKNSISYIPLIAFVLYFIEEDKTEELEKNIRYAIYFFFFYIFIVIFASIFSRFSTVAFIFFFIYLIISFVFGYKVYKGWEIDIDFIDSLHKKISKLGK